MSFAGHVFDMISRMKQNEALKNARRNKFKKAKNAYSKESIKYKIKNNLAKQKLSDSELNILKYKIRAKLKKERIRSIILTITTISTILLVLYYFLN